MSGKPFTIIVTPPPPNKDYEDVIKRMDSLSLNEKPKGGSSRNSRSTKGARRSTKGARKSKKVARKSAKGSRKSRKGSRKNRK